jgi:tetratricopeptide (TPR) repeat protein
MRTAAAVLILLALAAPVQAQPQTATEPDLIKRGVAARESGRDQYALELFREAFDRYHTPRAQAQMGLAYQALGRWSDADLHLRAALAATHDAWIGSNRRPLEQALGVVGLHVGTLEILCDVPGAEISVDGQPAGKLPLGAPLRLGAGTAIVQLQADGYAPVQKPVTVVAGQLTRESFVLVPVERASAPPPAFVSAPVEPPLAAEPAFLQRRSTLVAAAAATAVLGAVALWSGLDTLSARNSYRLMPTHEAYDAGTRKELRTNLLVGGTAVLGAATLGLGLFATHW